MWVASTHSRADLIKLEKQGWVFYGSCMVRKALGLMEIGPPVRPHKVRYKVRYIAQNVIKFSSVTDTTDF